MIILIYMANILFKEILLPGVVIVVIVGTVVAVASSELMNYYSFIYIDASKIILIIHKCLG